MGTINKPTIKEKKELDVAIKKLADKMHNKRLEATAKHSDFTDILHEILKYHTRHPNQSFGDVCFRIYKILDLTVLTSYPDCQVLERLEKMK